MIQELNLHPSAKYLMSHEINGFRIGMGDELHILQKTLQNVKEFSPVHTVHFRIFPKQFLHYPDYEEPFLRFIHLRKKCTVLHKSITFIIFSADEKIIKVQKGQVEEITFTDPDLIKLQVIMAMPFGQDGFLCRQLKTIVANFDKTKIEDTVGTYGSLTCEYEKYLKTTMQACKGLPKILFEQPLPQKHVPLFRRQLQSNQITLAEWPPIQRKPINFERLKKTFHQQAKNCKEVKKLIKKKVINYIPYFGGQQSLDEIFNIIYRSKFVIGAEGGIMHLARVTEVPFIMVIPNYVTDFLRLQHSAFDIWYRENYLLERTHPAPIAFIEEYDFKCSLQDLIVAANDWIDNKENDHITIFFRDRNKSGAKKLKALFEMSYGIDNLQLKGLNV